MNWKPILFGVFGAFAYIAISELLPNLNHALAGILGGVIFAAICYLLPKKIKDWKRGLISTVLFIIIIYIIRLSLNYFNT
ncbi:MAG: hypothetical protein HDR88_00845 [Bacteroides sp.]|nr:hypothetical protein [Bacteroides sp.]